MPKDNNQTPITPTTNSDDQSPVFMEETLPPMPQEAPITQDMAPVENKQDTKPNETPVETPIVDSGSAAPQDDAIMPPTVTSKNKKKFAGGKVIATILGLFLLIGGIGAGVLLVKQNQNINEKAWTQQTCESQDAILCPLPDYQATYEAGRANNVGILEECYCKYIGGGGGSGNTDNPTSGTCPNGNPFNNECVIIYCPNGDTNNDGACEVPDVGAWYGSKHTCGTKTFGTNECGQVDPVDDNGVYCELPGWDYDIKLSNCSGPLPPTTPPTDNSGTASCSDVKAYTESWVLIPQINLPSLNVGDKINLCVTGTSTGGSFDMARFKVNGVTLPDTTTIRPGSNDYCYLYTIPTVTSTFNIIGQIHHTSLGWK